VVSSTPRPHFTLGKDPVPILQEAGLAPGPVWTGGKSRPYRDSIPNRPARIQSLYRLSHPAHTIYIVLHKYRVCGCDLRSGKNRTHTKIPKEYGKEMQLQDKGKSLKCRPPNIIPTEFQETSSTELPLFAWDSVYRRHYVYSSGMSLSYTVLLPI